MGMYMLMITLKASCKRIIGLAEPGVALEKQAQARCVAASTANSRMAGVVW